MGHIKLLKYKNRGRSEAKQSRLTIVRWMPCAYSTSRDILLKIGRSVTKTAIGTLARKLQNLCQHSLNQHPFNPTAVRQCHIVRQPLVAQNLIRHLNHNVVGL